MCGNIRIRRAATEKVEGAKQLQRFENSVVAVVAQSHMNIYLITYY
jgi:hypothetical protein